MNKQEIASQSKMWIIESFFDLLHIKSFADISISEIAENADLDRRTFYRHYKSKEDVLSCFIHEIAKQYEQTMQEKMTFDNHSIAHTFFSICEKNKDILLLFYREKLLHLLLNDLHMLFFKYQSRFASLEELNNKNRQFFLAYHIGGFWNVLAMWLEGNCQQSVTQLSEIVAQIFETKQI